MSDKRVEAFKLLFGYTPTSVEGQVARFMRLEADQAPKPDIQWPEKKSTKLIGIKGNLAVGQALGFNEGIDACIEAFNKWRES